MSFAFYLIICVFVFGYLCIALEYPLKINKAATALLMCGTVDHFRCVWHRRYVNCFCERYLWRFS